MNKSGGLKLIVVFVMILLFLYFSNYRPDIKKDDRSRNLLTGMIGAGDPPLEKIVSVDIVGLKIDGDQLRISQEDHLNFGEAVGCLIKFNAAVINVSIYDPNKQNINDPTIKFFNVNSTYENDTLESDFTSVPHVVAVGYLPEEPLFGEWKCLAQTEDKINISTRLSMINQKPKLINVLRDIVVTSEQQNVTLNLKEYFEDPEQQTMHFSAIGYRHTGITINSEGNVTISNPRNYNGIEKIKFRAYDGIMGTLSNEVKIMLGSGIEAGSAGSCNIIWDCAPWNECINGMQNRICIDTNNCNNPIGKPQEIQSCVPLQTNIYSNEQNDNLNGILGKKITVQLDKRTIPDSLRNVIIVLIILLSFGLIGIIAYLIFIKSKAKKLKKEIKENKHFPNNENIKQNVIVQEAKAINLSELEKYIDTALKQKISEQKIKKDLQSVGWKQNDIVHSFDIVNLRQFVSKKIKEGHKEGNIKLTLKTKGWNQGIIDEVFKKD